MKKVPYLLLIALLFSASFLTSCSEDSESINFSETQNNDDAFLKTFYSGDFRLGKSVDINLSSHNRTAEGRFYTVTEVFVGNETVARGYNFVDKTTRKLVYFADVDRVNNVLTIVDLSTNERIITDRINELPEYEVTDRFNFIKVIEDPSFDPPANQIMGYRDCYRTGNHQYLYSGGEAVSESCEWNCARTFLGIKLRRFTMWAGC